MKLHLTSAYNVHTMLDAVRVYAESDVMGRHRLCDSAEEADMILFVEDGQFDDYLYKRLQLNTLVKRFPEKCYMYNEVDKPWCVLPGFYCNMPQRFFQSSRQIAFPMLTIPNELVAQIYQPDDRKERQWLYSFVGAGSHRCRQSVFALAERTAAIQNTSGFNVWDSDVDVRLQAERNYADIMADSLFVLCPRGIGTSSYRLFETMQAGRAPVIISDQWVEPKQVDWDFALRVAENEVDQIPEILQARASEARDRGEAARVAWESAYAPDQIFNTIAEALIELQHSVVVEPEVTLIDEARKVYLKNQNDALHLGRKVRDRVSGLFVPMENQG